MALQNKDNVCKKKDTRGCHSIFRIVIVFHYFKLLYKVLCHHLIIVAIKSSLYLIIYLLMAYELFKFESSLKIFLKIFNVWMCDKQKSLQLIYFIKFLKTFNSIKKVLKKVPKLIVRPLLFYLHYFSILIQNKKPSHFIFYLSSQIY